MPQIKKIRKKTIDHPKFARDFSSKSKIKKGKKKKKNLKPVSQFHIYREYGLSSARWLDLLGWLGL